MSWENILKNEPDFYGPNVQKLVEYAKKIIPDFRRKGHRATIKPELIPDSVAKKALELLSKVEFVNNQQGSEGELTADLGIAGNSRDAPFNIYRIETLWNSFESLGNEVGSVFIMELMIYPIWEGGGILCNLEVELFVEKPLKEMSDEEINKYANMVDWRKY